LTLFKRFQQSLDKMLINIGPLPVTTNSPSGFSSKDEENAVLRMSNIELLETLGAVVDALNANTLNHSGQVAIYSVALARAIGLPPEEQERIFKAALVHDVGMIVISSAALDKPGRLSQEEMEQLRLHPTVSGEIVGRINSLRELAPLVHYHHERFDGNGYPDRLCGDEIPIGARILSLSDSLDAMLTGRPGRPARQLSEVLIEVQRNAGSQFDPQVVQAFFMLAAERGENFFHSSNLEASSDMLLTTLGIRSGRAAQIIKGE
jgi:HD-GYP domain-containing protein (c-di-GMP phosphodiesterase class II)